MSNKRFALKELEMFSLYQQSAPCISDNSSRFTVALDAWVRAQFRDEFEELKSVVDVLSRGVSGLTLSSSKPDGLTSAKLAGVPSRARSMEMLIRWMELNAFTGMFWSPERLMSSIPAPCRSDERVLKYLDRFARVCECLVPYRESLAAETASAGRPVVRPLFLHYQDDSLVLNLRRQFMFGADFLIAPVLERGATSVCAYLPSGNWTHLWTGRRHIAAVGDWTEVAAPLGEPGVFYRTGARSGELLVLSLMEAGVV